MIPGFRFQPSEEELILGFLLPKIKGEALPWNGIVERKVYGDEAAPWVVFSDAGDPSSLLWNRKKEGGMTKDSTYVFTTLGRVPNKKNIPRMAGGGTWKGQTTGKKIKNSNTGAIIGNLKMFTFESPKFDVTVSSELGHWIMHEYALDGAALEETELRGACDLVICKITRCTNKSSGSGIIPRAPLQPPTFVLPCKRAAEEYLDQEEEEASRKKHKYCDGEGFFDAPPTEPTGGEGSLEYAAEAVGGEGFLDAAAIEAVGGEGFWDAAAIEAIGGEGFLDALATEAVGGGFVDAPVTQAEAVYHDGGYIDEEATQVVGGQGSLEYYAAPIEAIGGEGYLDAPATQAEAVYHDGGYIDAEATQVVGGEGSLEYNAAPIEAVGGEGSLDASATQAEAVGSEEFSDAAATETVGVFEDPDSWLNNLAPSLDDGIIVDDLDDWFFPHSGVSCGFSPTLQGF